MSSSEPWVTLGRTREKALQLVTRPDRESYVALRDGRVAGFVVLCMQGAFVGYIQTVCVAADSRCHGIGSRLIEFAEAEGLALIASAVSSWGFLA